MPIVKSFVQAGKTVIAIRDLFCLKKTIRFIIEMNNGSLNPDKLEEHRLFLETHPDKLKREMESVLIYLDRENEAVKASILARFYKLYIDETIRFDWEDFKIFFADNNRNQAYIPFSFRPRSNSNGSPSAYPRYIVRMPYLSPSSDLHLCLFRYTSRFLLKPGAFFLLIPQFR